MNDIEPASWIFKHLLANATRRKSCHCVEVDACFVYVSAKGKKVTDLHWPSLSSDQRASLEGLSVAVAELTTVRPSY